MLRVDYFRHEVVIHQGIKDEKSAETAAKQVRVLLPLQKSIGEPTEELGQEHPDFTRKRR